MNKVVVKDGVASVCAEFGYTFGVWVMWEASADWQTALHDYATGWEMNTEEVLQDARFIHAALSEAGIEHEFEAVMP